ncbi:hypothetical protein QFC20_003928 [Naganishia adeliensis]|uniref:Uncharacterized protein n=1 Tax=Naganishia adeliensis TaxID=92952 RepID=A0ACC2W6V5_9TREE|nr:hypothetical protein QFC20_003928 [Naganishia adeliensis]
MLNDDTNTIAGQPDDQLKPTISHSEKVDNVHEDAERAQILSDEDLSPEEEKALLRRIDIKILPLVTALYLLSFLDRTNIGQANVAGLSTDLGLSSSQYQVALVVFFVGYIVIELPFNLMLKRFKPPMVIGISMVIWGICCVCIGLVQNAGGLTGTRFLLGIFEGGLFPGLNLLLSCWYSRKEQNTRIAIFFAGASLSGAFGGALAYGIARMDGVAGLEGWRWIFILEGILTVLVALFSFRYLVSFPEDEKNLLSPQEARKWKHRLALSQGITNIDIKENVRHQILNTFLDWRAWAYALIMSLFSPTIIRDLGFAKSAVANLLIVPPYFLGFLTCLGIAVLSDRAGVRAPFIIGCMSITAIGFIILIAVDGTPGVKYFAVHLAVAGISPSVATSCTFAVSAFGPHAVRATAFGLFMILGNAMGMVSSVLYPAADAPRYVKGHATNLAFAFLAITMASILMYDNWRKNKARDAFRFAHPDGRDFDYRNATTAAEKEKWGISHLRDDQVLALGHNHPAFRFQLFKHNL